MRNIPEEYANSGENYRDGFKACETFLCWHGMPPAFKDVIRNRLLQVYESPEVQAAEQMRQAADMWGLTEDNIAAATIRKLERAGL